MSMETSDVASPGANGLAGSDSHASRPHISADSFERIKLIGTGDVGRVYLVRHRETNHLYAMKTLDKATVIKRDKIRRSLTERDVLATVDHPLIVRLHWCFQSLERLYFIMDYCAGGSLFRYVHQHPNKCLPEEHVRFYMAEILLALEYLHMNGFIYRDLKSENVLIQASGHIMLTDFDLSTSGDHEVKTDHRRHEPFAHPLTHSNSFVGTLEYLAPEVIKGSSQTSSVDWWTFGILMYELLYGVTPYEGKARERSTREMCSSILEGALRFPDHHVNSVSHECKSLIKKLLAPDPKKRLGTHHDANDLKHSKFFLKVNFALILNCHPPYVPELADPLDTSFATDDDQLPEEPETDSEISEDEQKSGPFKDFKHLDNEAKLHRRTPSASLGSSNVTSQPSLAASDSTASPNSSVDALDGSTVGAMSLLQIGTEAIRRAGPDGKGLRRSQEAPRTPSPDLSLKRAPFQQQSPVLSPP
eukprot:TRINITY_DN5913_c0_g1_i1.p1 TRINITY_DN5913_c0_g1~~TRINITY_DN5913_c0_g1_i1.p1  ORF type:complete len:475 (+),score=170.50 TRINITY_DN5913_c0_g1_i1:81-1505(+)